MTIGELTALLDAKAITGGDAPETQISCGYACDMLSWVMAHGEKGMAWTTVQTHVNVVAVAVLMEMACVVLAEGNELEPASVRKAKAEGLTVLETAKTAYEVCGLMYQAGVAISAKTK